MAPTSPGIDAAGDIGAVCNAGCGQEKTPLRIIGDRYFLLPNPRSGGMADVYSNFLALCGTF